jgi:hypothetical protein
LNFLKESIKGGGLAYQTQINQLLRSHMEGKESIELKRRLKMIDLSELRKTCEGNIGKARAPKSFFPSCAYFKKSQDTKISLAEQVRY